LSFWRDLPNSRAFRIVAQPEPDQGTNQMPDGDVSALNVRDG